MRSSLTRFWWVASLVSAWACSTPLAPSFPVMVSDEQNADESAKRCLGQPNVLGTRINATEPHAAVNPANPNHVVVAWQAGGANGAVLQSATSLDGGTTWTGPASAPMSACSGGPDARLVRIADPWLAIDGAGRVYLAGLGFGGEAYGLIVASSADQGRTWSASTVVDGTDGELAFYDNASIAADPTRPSTLYVATTHYTRDAPDERATHYGPIGFSRSTDGGATWSRLMDVGERMPNGRVSAPQILTDPRTERIYLIYFRRDKDTRIVGVRSSGDAGVSWSPEVVAAHHVAGSEQPREPIVDRPMRYADDIVQGAIDLHTGAIYLVYADARRQPGATLGVSLVASADGITWSSPRDVSSGPDAAWLPSVAVAPSGTVGVLYVSADMRTRTDGIAPIEVRLHKFRRAGHGLESMGDIAIDRSNYTWPGDYMRLIYSAGGFLAAYARSPNEPDEPLPVTAGPLRDSRSRVFVRRGLSP